MKYLGFIIFSVFFFYNEALFAQRKSSPEFVEQKIANSISEGYKATVYIIEYDTLTNEVQQGAGFSGVVVTSAGNILTVSHAAQPGQIYQVSFPNGKKYLAKGLGRIGIQNDSCDLDLAMIKITDQGVWPFAKIGSSSLLNLHQPAISIAYPSTFESTSPSVRFGRITNLKTAHGYLESSCKMEPGDSGGPLFDEYGHVIGLHSWINEDENENFEVPVDLYLKYWTALNVERDYLELPSEDVPLPKLETYGRSQPIPDRSNIFEMKKIFGEFTVLIQSTSNAGKTNILGTLVRPDEKSDTRYVVSKSSMVLDSPIVNINGSSYLAEVISRDNREDLVLLELPIAQKKALNLSIIDNQVEKGRAPGKFVLSGLDQGIGKVGVLSSYFISMPSSYSIGYFGANATYIDHAITVTEIGEGSAASKWLKLNDKIIAVNGIRLTQPEQYGSELAKYMVGDSISVDAIRELDTIHLKMRLPAFPEVKHVSTAFKGGRSLRSDGFEKVLVQDAAIKAEECGSPVFDTSGYFVGLNIARHSRTSSIIMPASQVLNFVKVGVALKYISSK